MPRRDKALARTYFTAVTSRKRASRTSGSACTTGSLEPSHVLVAMGCDAGRARGSIRFSLGIYNTEAEVDHVLECLPPIIEKLRARAPVRYA